MLSQQLRNQTKSNHQMLEKVLIPQIMNIQTKENYSDILLIFYQYFGALESQIDVFINTDILPDYPLRRKTAALKSDLEQLGATKFNILSERTPDIANYLQALGALYVVEGSTLGGEIISKMIRNILGEQIEPALSFFKGYGDGSKLMWEKFQQTIDNLELSESQKQEIIHSANQTFIKFRELAQNPVS